MRLGRKESDDCVFDCSLEVRIPNLLLMENTDGRSRVFIYEVEYRIDLYLTSKIAKESYTLH